VAEPPISANSASAAMTVLTLKSFNCPPCRVGLERFPPGCADLLR
jgi:hypothetical protein